MGRPKPSLKRPQAKTVASDQPEAPKTEPAPIDSAPPASETALPRKPKAAPAWVHVLADRAEATSAAKDPTLPQPEAKPERQLAPAPQPVTAAMVRDEVARLAGLDTIERELARRDVAKALGIRDSTLDKLVTEHLKALASTASPDPLSHDITPWPDPVGGAELLTEIQARILRHMVMAEHGATAVALWIIHAHCIDAGTHSPLLFISSPTKQCGKSTLLDLLTRLVPRPLPAANVTAAVVFRSIPAADR